MLMVVTDDQRGSSTTVRSYLMSPRTRARSRRSLAVIAAAALLAPFALSTTAASAATVSVLDDFEGGAPAGFFGYGNAGFGIVDIAADSPDAKPGQEGQNTVVSYGWDLTPSGSFGGVGHNFSGAIDATSFDGVRFALRGSGNGSALQFELFDGGANPDSSERFDVTITDDIAGWREIELPWSAFSRATDFQPVGAPDDGLTLDTVWGYALPAVNGQNTVLVDDIVLYSDDTITPAVSLAASSYEAIEGNDVTVGVRLNVAPTETTTVELSTADGTALAGEDYAATSVEVTFAPGETTKSVVIATLEDDIEEPTETFTVSLAAATGALIGTPSTATVSIIDDDAAVVGPPTGRTLIVDDLEAPLASGADGDIAVGWLAAQDPSSSVAFAATDSPPAPVPGAPEGNTVLGVDFDVVSFGVVVHNFENETADAWVPQDWSTYEGIGFWMYGNGSGTDLFFDILDNRNPDSTTDDAERFVVSFRDTWSGWQFKTFDFTEFTRKNIGNGAPNDGLTLTDMHGYALGSLRTTTPQTFYYDDVLLYGQAAEVPLSVGLDRAGYVVTEGDEVTATVRLTRVSEEDVVVDYTTEESVARTATEDLPATADRDFVPTNGTLTIPAGEREASFTVATIDDDKWEVDETFLVRLGEPTGAEAGFALTATVSIRDNDEKDTDLVDDFETFPWLFDTSPRVDLELREIAADSGDGYAGQSEFETVLDLAHRGPGTISRDFPTGQDWSDAEGLSFWYQGDSKPKRVTVGLSDNGAPDPGPENWVLSWSDEFDGPAGAPANPENWTYETGGWGWGNDEFQYYTDSTDNAALDGEGNLVITAREIDPETTDLECWYGPCTHTSARLITEQKQEFEYGRIESRVFVPQGSGIWPAVWSLGTDFREVGWPQTGEIDVMEFVGRLPNEIFGTIHGPGYSGGQSYGDVYEFDVPVYEDWHTFSVEWTPEKIDWFVDGIQYHTASPADIAPNEWVFDHPFSLLTNVAVGGNFGGALGEDLVFPQSLLVDYVRVYQAPDTAERFEATVQLRGSGWQQVTVPFEDFRRSKSQPAGAPNDGLTLTDVQGYSLTFGGAGSVSIDRVALAR